MHSFVTDGDVGGQLLRQRLQAMVSGQGAPFPSLMQMAGGYFPGAQALGAGGASPALLTPTGLKGQGASPQSRPAPMFASPPRPSLWPGQVELTAESKEEAAKTGEGLWTDLKSDDPEKKRAAIRNYTEYAEVAQRMQVSQDVLRAKVIVQTFDLFKIAG